MNFEESTARVQAFLDERQTGLKVLVTEGDTSTVPAAAATLGVEPGQIAKTLAVRAGEETFLLVLSGDSRLDNAKFRKQFNAKPRMLSAEETLALTGQAVGGVGPFGHPPSITVYCDEALLRFDTVYPAAGSPTSAVRTTPYQIADLTSATWVDVARLPDGTA